MLGAKGYSYTLRIYNTYCFYMATMVTAKPPVYNHMTWMVYNTTVGIWVCWTEGESLIITFSYASKPCAAICVTHCHWTWCGHLNLHSYFSSLRILAHGKIKVQRKNISIIGSCLTFSSEIFPLFWILKSRKLKALSIVHFIFLNISLKMALQIGPKYVAGITV
jgi:hypothetical protein